MENNPISDADVPTWRELFYRQCALDVLGPASRALEEKAIFGDAIRRQTVDARKANEVRRE